MPHPDVPSYHTQIANFTLPKTSFLALEEYTPIEGDLFSSLANAMFGETILVAPSLINRHFSIVFPFTPPQLRTSLIVNDITLSLPPLEIEVSGLLPKYQFDVEIGWITSIILSGSSPFFTENIIASVFSLQNGVQELAHIPPITKTVQVQPQVTVQPGSSFDIYAIPYLRILTVIKAEEPIIIVLRPPGIGIIPLHPKKPNTATCTIANISEFRD